MKRTGLFYGSTDGRTAAVADRLRARLDALLLPAGAAAVEMFDVADYLLEEMLDFDWLVVGVPTWNHGQLQRDWERSIGELAALDLHGKRAAVFGLGDQVGYPDTFVDAIFFVADHLAAAGAELVGSWPTAGYDFRSSWAVADGRFLGLVLDEDNQPHLSEARLEAWSRQIVAEFSTESSTESGPETGTETGPETGRG